jgi:hypothetical protein
MQVPEPPRPVKLVDISPSIYEASLNCLAKAVWYSAGERRILPDHPAAILGTCFHAVLAAANMGRFNGDSETGRVPARDSFDQQAKSLYENAHPLLQAKFPSVERMPYYNLYRERAALHAAFIAASRRTSSVSADVGTQAMRGQWRTEKHLASSDGLIVGRPDYVERTSGTIVDYKTGVAAEGQLSVVTEPEARQLRLYAYLVSQGGAVTSKGAIVRGDGRRSEIEIPTSAADAEAFRARVQLQAMNAARDAGRSFDDLASPSAGNCCMCACIPLCNAFWREAKPEWADSCGLHVEGRVKEISRTTIQGFALVTVGVEVSRGTVGSAFASVEQVPESWLTIRGSSLPAVGDVIRIVHARQPASDADVVIMRADKALTSLWVVP